MTRGTVGAELELTFSFHADEAGRRNLLAKFESATLEGIELPEHISTVLWRFMRDLKMVDKLVDAAADNADDEADDAGCDEARMPGAAE